MVFSLKQKRIIVGVTGGIAAYKAAELVRALKKHGADVRVVMTAAAQNFVGELTFQALSGNPVHSRLLDPEAEAGMGHIELARWADCLVVAPATANTLAKVVAAQADDLLLTLVLARRSPLLVAPAMNQAMWHNPATQNVISQLRGDGVKVLGPAEGEQACGDVGEGRMLEPAVILEHIAAVFDGQALLGKKVVITAGPTQEPIDPVRYISNHSSGKMGYALAVAAAEMGAETILVSGPVSLAAPDRVEVVKVQSAQQMLDCVLEKIDKADIFISAAAVADYRPQSVQTQKIKKSESELHIALVKNTDILHTVGHLAKDKRPALVIGFAAETQNLAQHATEKLDKKNLDGIVANNVAEGDGVFNSDSNQVLWIDRQQQIAYERQPKTKLARALMVELANKLL